MEKVNKAFSEKFEKLTEDERWDVRTQAYGIVAREEPVSGKGFEAYYITIYRRFLPRIYHVIVNAFVKAYYEKTGVMVQGFRGLGKTTLLAAWGSYLVGKRPVGSTCIIRINDGAAQETGKAIAGIIEMNPGWKACFPNVVPDKDRGWSSEAGYFVWDSNVSKEEWAQKTLADHVAEPSLLSSGVESGALIGKHPTNGMWFDDLHDERNTRSAREMQSVVDVLRSNIIPTWRSIGGKPTIGVVCTPWSEKDAYAAMLETGIFELIRIPIFERDDNGVMFEPMGIKIKLSLPNVFDMESVEKLYNENPVQFPRMYLCDLEMMKGTVLKKEWLHEYPREKINWSWPVYFGIDFASVEDKMKSDQRDYFALSVCVALPGGGLILVDGFRGKLSTLESFDRVKVYAAKYPTLVSVGVEKWGKGEEFKNQLVYGTNLTIIPCPYKGTPVKSKGQRYQDGLAPAFTSGRMWISDVDTDFTKAFKDEWIGWDGGKSKTGHDDCLDSVYWAAYIAQSHLMPNTPVEISVKPVKKVNPWNSLGGRT